MYFKEKSDAEKENYSKLNNKGNLELSPFLIANEYLAKKILIKEVVFKNAISNLKAL